MKFKQLLNRHKIHILFMLFIVPLFMTGCGITQQTKEKITDAAETSARQAAMESVRSFSRKLAEKMEKNQDVNQEQLEELISKSAKKGSATAMKAFRKEVQKIPSDQMPAWLRTILMLMAGGGITGVPAFAAGKKRGRQEKA